MALAGTSTGDATGQGTGAKTATADAASTTTTKDWIVVPFGGSNGNARRAIVRELADEASATAISVWLDPDADTVLPTAPNRNDLALAYPETQLVQYSVNSAPTDAVNGFAIPLPAGGFEVYSDYALTNLLTQDPAATVATPGATGTEIIPETIAPRTSSTAQIPTPVLYKLAGALGPADGVFLGYRSEGVIYSDVDLTTTVANVGIFGERLEEDIPFSLNTPGASSPVINLRFVQSLVLTDSLTGHPGGGTPLTVTMKITNEQTPPAAIADYPSYDAEEGRQVFLIDTTEKEQLSLSIPEAQTYGIFARLDTAADGFGAANISGLIHIVRRPDNG